MRELIQQVFKSYGFDEKWQDDGIEFYSAESEEKTSFFLIDYIEAIGEGITDVKMLAMLKRLEKDYIDENTNGKDVKRKIQELFVNDNASIACLLYTSQALYQYCDFFDNHMRTDTDVMNCVKAQDYSGSASVSYTHLDVYKRQV